MKRLRTMTAAPLLAGVVLAYLVAVALYAAAVPVLEGFDAQAHYAAVHYYRAERTLPVLSPELVHYSYELVPHPPLYYVLAAVAGSGWPLQPALDAARASNNVYFDKSLSERQTVTLPAVPWQELAPIWAARIVSMLGGLILVLCTWWLARRLAPQSPLLALAATAIAALNPQLLFTAVSISNDAWAAATCALALAAGVDVVLGARQPRAWLWVGVAVGVAALTKYSSLAIALPLGLLYLVYWRRTGGKAAGQALAWAALGFGVVAGWWFVRNWLLYHELIPFDRMAVALPSMRRPEPYTWAHTLQLAPWLFAAYWGVFVAVIAPAWYLDLTRWLVILGLAGLVVALVRVIWARRWDVRQTVLYGVLLPWLAVVAASVLYWTRTIEYGEQGRLGLIGASALGVVVAAGWQGWLPRRWAPVLHAMLAAGMLVLALLLLPFLHAHYGLPPAVSTPLKPDRALDAHFAGGMKVLGVDLPQGAALEPGKPLTVTVYLGADAPIPADYTLFLHVAGPDDRLLYQFDGVPAAGRHPTRQWVPGQVFADTHVITVTNAPGGTNAPAGELATLSLGFYPANDRQARQPVSAADGAPIGDRLVLARLHLADGAPAPAPAGPPLAAWSNGIALAQARLNTGANGLPAGLAVTWTTTATLQQDYTVFVQALDAGNHILAQVDSQPRGGQWPTSTWRAGDVITDSLPLDGELGAWQRVIVGLYDAGGARLPLVGPGAAENAFEVARR